MTVRTRAQLLADFADNTSGLITEQKLRNLVDSITLTAEGADGTYTRWSEEVLAANAATFAATLPTGYRDAKIIVRGAGTNVDVSYTRPRLRFNGDATAGNYDWARGNFTNGGFSSEYDGGGGGAITTAIDFGLLPSGAPDYANARGVSEVTVFNYLDAAYKAMTYDASATATGVYFRMSGAGLWKSVAAITDILVFASNGSGVATNFKAGSVCSVYVRR